MHLNNFWKIKEMYKFSFTEFSFSILSFLDCACAVTLKICSISTKHHFFQWRRLIPNLFFWRDCFSHSFVWSKVTSQSSCMPLFYQSTCVELSQYLIAWNTCLPSKSLYQKTLYQITALTLLNSFYIYIFFTSK